MQSEWATLSVEALRAWAAEQLRSLRMMRSDEECPERSVGKRSRGAEATREVDEQALCNAVDQFLVTAPGFIKRMLKLAVFDGWSELLTLFVGLCGECADAAPSPQLTERIVELFASNKPALSAMDDVAIQEYAQLWDRLLRTSSDSSASAVLTAADLQCEALMHWKKLVLPVQVEMWFISGEVSCGTRDGLVALHALTASRVLLGRCLASSSAREVADATCDRRLATLISIIPTSSEPTSATLLRLHENDTDLFQALLHLLEIEVALITHAATIARRLPLSYAALLDLVERARSAALFVSVCLRLCHGDADLFVDLLASPETVFLSYLVKFLKHHVWTDVEEAAMAGVHSPPEVASGDESAGCAQGVAVWVDQLLLRPGDDASKTAKPPLVCMHPRERQPTPRSITMPTQPTLVEATALRDNDLANLREMLATLAAKLRSMHDLGLAPFHPRSLWQRIDNFLAGSRR